MSSGFERRACPRFDAQVPLRISGTGFTLAADTKNISCAGLYCRVGCFIPVMTKLALTMFIPLVVDGQKVEKQIWCTAVVVRIEPEEERSSSCDYHVGFFFSAIENRDKDIIAQYIQQSFFASSN